jgi:hypothetical protein
VGWGKEGERAGGREGGRDRGREGATDGGRQGGRKGGREGRMEMFRKENNRQQQIATHTPPRKAAIAISSGPLQSHDRSIFRVEG